jgi:carboxymethylenebutenolidase
MRETRAFAATFPSQAGPIEGWIAHPAAPGRYPAIVLLSGIGGMQPQYRVVAEQFAQEGIVGVGLNWMMREKDPSDPTIMQDVDGCARFLKEQPYVDPDQIVLSGYCRGGTLALLGLGQLPHFSAGVIFHGGPFYDRTRDRPSPFDLSIEKRPIEPYALAERMPPLIMLHGATDDVVPIEQMYRFAERLEELGKRFELKVYSGTGHAFTLYGEAQGRWWHAEHAMDAFREAVMFIRRIYDLPAEGVELRTPGSMPSALQPA